MPKNTFTQKAKELLSECQSCDQLVSSLAEFFIVSRISVKLRLIEVGLEAEANNFDDYDDVFEEIRHSKEYAPISKEDALLLINENAIFDEWIKSRGFIFVDGYFVLPDKKYVTSKNGVYHLTKYARNNISSCVINLIEQHHVSYEYAKKDLINCAVLYYSEVGGIDRRIVYFSPRVQSNLPEVTDKEQAGVFKEAANALITYDEETEKELLRRLSDEDTTLCDCLCFLMTQQGWETPLDFYSATNLHENYFRRIKNNEINNMKSDTLMAICVGLGLRLRIIEKLYDKAEQCKLHYYEEPDKTRIRILETFPGLNIGEFSSLLKASHQPTLGTKNRTA